MGIDAEMFVRTRARITVDQVRDWAYRLGSTFGAESFWIFKREGEPVRHCLQIVDEYTQDGPTLKPEKGETFIRVYPATRYYGEGYERGNLPLLIAVAEWLERNIPHAKVWYGGDSSGVEATAFDAKARRHLMRHFCDQGHEPYERAFDSDHGDGIAAPLCKCCWKKMKRYGWGPKYAAFICNGCGENTLTRDGGQTFEQRRDDWETALNNPHAECPKCQTPLVTNDAGRTFIARSDAEVMAERERKAKERRKKEA